MEKLNVAIADDNERMVSLLETLIKDDNELERWDRLTTGRTSVISSRRKNRMWCFWISSCRRWTVSPLWKK